MSYPYRVKITRIVTQEFDVVVELPHTLTTKTPNSANTRRAIESLVKNPELIGEAIRTGNYESFRPAQSSISVSDFVPLFDTNPDAEKKTPYVAPEFTLNARYSNEKGWELIQ